MNSKTIVNIGVQRFDRIREQGAFTLIRPTLLENGGKAVRM